MVLTENEERMRMAKEAGMPEDEVPLIKATWFVDDYWYFYYLSPFGDILREGKRLTSMEAIHMFSRHIRSLMVKSIHSLLM